MSDTKHNSDSSVPGYRAVPSFAEPLALAPGARMGVVLVNWNGAAYTTECLETLLRSNIPLQVVVVDNASNDGSLDHIEAWASGNSLCEPSADEMAAFSTPALRKPLPLTRFAPGEAETKPPITGSISLIDSGGNLGFAGGNNVGIRHLLQNPEINCIWLLNNDTIVEPDAAQQLLAEFNTDQMLGMCGTVVKYYFRPDTVQALNGSTFNLLTGQGKSIGGNKPLSSHMSPKTVVAKTDFVLGASLCVSRKFVEEIGLMAEDYFLYYEEIDWATRNNNHRPAPFRVGFARGAVVYHKEGGSIGSGGGKGQRSVTSDYYMLRARLIFYRLHYPILLPLQWMQAFALIGRRILRRQPTKAIALFKALLGMKPA